uniref:Uncharacterized protein n=1 Tax=Arundo donax TaxID=35708 RepID=A0A0A8XTG2_ARUDO
MFRCLHHKYIYKQRHVLYCVQCVLLSLFQYHHYYLMPWQPIVSQTVVPLNGCSVGFLLRMLRCVTCSMVALLDLYRANRNLMVVSHGTSLLLCKLRD